MSKSVVFRWLYLINFFFNYINNSVECSFCRDMGSDAARHKNISSLLAASFYSIVLVGLPAQNPPYVSSSFARSGISLRVQECLSHLHHSQIQLTLWSMCNGCISVVTDSILRSCSYLLGTSKCNDRPAVHGLTQHWPPSSCVHLDHENTTLSYC